MRGGPERVKATSKGIACLHFGIEAQPNRISDKTCIGVDYSELNLIESWTLSRKIRGRTLSTGCSFL